MTRADVDRLYADLQIGPEERLGEIEAKVAARSKA